MSTELQKSDAAELAVIPTEVSAAALELAVGKGDFSRLSPKDRMEYIGAICKWAGLNPLTKPIDIIDIKGKTVLYANKSCAEQLRGLHQISVKILERTFENGVYIVRASARRPNGQEDESIGAVPFFDKGSPEDRANAMMKAETKAKRRVTLSICGLGFMPDETELETIPGAKAAKVEAATSAETTSDRTALLNAEETETADGKVIDLPVSASGAGPVGDTLKDMPANGAIEEPSKVSPAPPHPDPLPQGGEGNNKQAPTLTPTAGELEADTVRKLEAVLMGTGKPDVCLEFLVARGYMPAKDKLELCRPAIAAKVIENPQAFLRSVEQWEKGAKKV